VVYGSWFMVYGQQSMVSNLYFMAHGSWFVVNSVWGYGVKTRLRVTCNAKEPFLTGRELISQGCDWPNENLVSIPGKQHFKFYCHFLRRSRQSSQGLFPVTIVFAKKFCAPHTTTQVFTLAKSGGEARKIRKNIFLKDLTPPDFCLFDIARRVENCVSHWPKNGGVLRGSGRGGSRFTIYGLGVRTQSFGFEAYGLWAKVLS